ncbi:hypothetical protein HPB49_018075 [Dermacentor silvarum]|uniref:Uncharacterized protein n=1 Tax=Dermacentor silvarum TaxID=543639 RepID=A0ACB8D753_DERSI|nr:hypothetical protein HPB49_018075 [Dermacentor silvarum]
MASAMETEFEPDVRQEQEAQDLQPRLIHIVGRTAIAVQGEILPDDDIAGWETGARQPRQHKPTSHACFNGESTPAGKKHESRYTQAQYVKKVTANLTRMARMPTKIPREECKIIIRPRGGLNTGRTEAPTLTAAIWTAAGITKAEAMQDTVCANVAQNIIVVSTPDEQRARHYATIRSLIIGEQAHETYAYFAAPHDTSKGVIHGIPKTETTADIRENIMHPGNPKAIEAHRIGETTAVLVLFQGQKVPSTVKYGVTIVRCSPYCQYHQVCRTCGKIGHRQDVCPQPNTKVCFNCGKPNPSDTHAEECKPRCKLCNGPHPTGAPGCSNRFKLPYLLKKRRWENARHTSSTHVSIAVNDNPAEFPPLKADRPLEERKRSASRSCLRGVQGGDSGRATSHGRESRSRSKRRTAESARRESRSLERATWSEKVANHHRSKIRTPQIEDTMRALQQDNANLRAENRNLKAQVRELKQGQAEILRLLRAGQQPAGTTRMDIAQAAQRSLTPTPPTQQVPDQRSATPLIAWRTPTTEPPSTAPQHETGEDMEEHTAEISRPSFKEHRAINRERESTNARLNRHEKRIELLEKRLNALELRVTTGFAETKALLNQILNKNNTTNEENNICSMTPIPQTWTETPQPAQD